MRNAHQGTTVVAEMLETAVAREHLERAARLIRMAGRKITLVSFSDWREMASALQSDDTVAVIDPYAKGVLRVRELMGLAASGVAGLVMLLGDFRSVGLATDVRQLVGLGFETIRTIGGDDQPYKLADDLLGLFDSASQLAAEIRALEPHLAPQQAFVLRWAMRRGRYPLNLKYVAKELGVSARTLRRWCGGTPGLTAGQTLQWVRLLHASLAISTQSPIPVGRTVQRLHFSSYSDFCRRYRRLVGVSVADVPRKRLYDEAVVAFRAAVTPQNGSATA